LEDTKLTWMIDKMWVGLKKKDYHFYYFNIENTK